MTSVQFPCLYVTIFRNVRSRSVNDIIEYNKFVEGVRTILYKAPACLYRNIAHEMITMGFFEQCNHKYIRIIKNKQIEKEVAKLKPHIFPIDFK